MFSDPYREFLESTKNVSIAGDQFAFAIRNVRQSPEAINAVRRGDHCWLIWRNGFLSPQKSLSGLFAGAFLTLGYDNVLKWTE